MFILRRSVSPLIIKWYVTSCSTEQNLSVMYFLKSEIFCLKFILCHLESLMVYYWIEMSLYLSLLMMRKKLFSNKVPILFFWTLVLPRLLVHSLYLQ